MKKLLGTRSKEYGSTGLILWLERAFVILVMGLAIPFMVILSGVVNLWRLVRR